MSGSPTWVPPPPAATGRESPIPRRRAHRHRGRAHSPDAITGARGFTTLSQPRQNHRIISNRPSTPVIVTRLSQDSALINPASALRPPPNDRSRLDRTLPSRHLAATMRRCHLTHTRTRPVGVRATRPCAPNGLAHNGYIPLLREISANQARTEADGSDRRMPHTPNDSRARRFVD